MFDSSIFTHKSQFSHIRNLTGQLFTNINIYYCTQIYHYILTVLSGAADDDRAKLEDDDDKGLNTLLGW